MTDLVSAFRLHGRGESTVAARARLLAHPLANPALQAAVGPRSGYEAVLGAACPTAVWSPPEGEEARVLAELISVDKATARAIVWSHRAFGDWAGALSAAETIFAEPLSVAGRHAATGLLEGLRRENPANRLPDQRV